MREQIRNHVRSHRSRFDAASTPLLAHSFSRRSTSKDGFVRRPIDPRTDVTVVDLDAVTSGVPPHSTCFDRGGSSAAFAGTGARKVCRLTGSKVGGGSAGEQESAVHL